MFSNLKLELCLKQSDTPKMFGAVASLAPPTPDATPVHATLLRAYVKTHQELMNVDYKSTALMAPTDN